MSSLPSKLSLKIGIIGLGPFAQFLAKTMIRQGHTIRATSRSDYTDLSTQLGISFFRDTSEFLELDNDVILLSTSILSLSEVIKALPLDRLKRPTLFVDVLSVKEYPRDLMLQALPRDSDVLCTHPMFGPESGKDGWKDLSFMFDRVRIRNEATCSTFLHIFASEGCKMMEMSCEEHDKLSAASQFLTHTIGRVLAEMEVEPTPIDTKGFQKLVQVKESTSRDSFDLFSGLFVHNRFAKQQVMDRITCFICGESCVRPQPCQIFVSKLIFKHGFWIQVFDPSYCETLSHISFHMQLRKLELALDSIKQRLEKSNEELEQT